MCTELPYTPCLSGVACGVDAIRSILTFVGLRHKDERKNSFVRETGEKFLHRRNHPNQLATAATPCLNFAFASANDVGRADAKAMRVLQNV